VALDEFSTSSAGLSNFSWIVGGVIGEGWKRKRGHSTFRFSSEAVLKVESLLLDKKKQMSAFFPVMES